MSIEPAVANQPSQLHLLQRVIPQDWQLRLGLRQEWQKLITPIPWTLIGHLTFTASTITLPRVWKEFHRWRGKVERRLNGRRPVSWYACPELQLRGALHLSVLLSDIHPAQYAAAENLWPGNPHIRPFDEMRRYAAIRYVTKEILFGMEPNVGGPGFPSVIRTPVPRLPKKRTRRRRAVMVIEFRLTSEDHELIHVAFARARKGYGTRPVKDTWLLDLLVLSFNATRRMSLVDRVLGYRRKIDGRMGIGTVLRILRSPLTSPVSSPSGTCVSVLRFALSTKRHVNPYDRIPRPSQWDNMNSALRNAQGMAPAMSRETALCWLCLDWLIDNADPSEVLPDGRLMIEFLLWHLARLFEQAAG